MKKETTPNTKDKLGDLPHPFHYKILKTPIYFLDETGILNNSTDQYFAIGAAKFYRPHEIQAEIAKERQRFKIKEELKWNKMSNYKLDICKKMLDLFFSCPSASFSCVVMKKTELDFDKYFDNDFFKVYKSFSVILLKMNMERKENEIATVVADNYFCPPNTNLELATRAIVNDHYKKMMISHYMQIDSKSSDLLQLADILLGATLFDLKIQSGFLKAKKGSPKMKLLKHLHDLLSIDESFFVDKDGNQTKKYIKKNKYKVIIFDPQKSKRTIEKGKEEENTDNPK